MERWRTKEKIKILSNELSVYIQFYLRLSNNQTCANEKAHASKQHNTFLFNPSAFLLKSNKIGMSLFHFASVAPSPRIAATMASQPNKYNPRILIYLNDPYLYYCLIKKKLESV